MKPSTLRNYFPTSRCDHQIVLGPNQRYRHPFSDLRLSRTAKRLLSRLIAKRTSTLSRCTRSKNEVTAIYRFLSNERVTLEELIHYVTDLSDKSLKNKELYAFLDSSSINLLMGPKGHSSRENWPSRFGVIGDNRSPGFYVMPSLLKDAREGHILGLGDILIHSRSQTKASKKKNKAIREQRQALPLEHKESGAWSRVALGTSKQLREASKVTYIMDQGADDYASLSTILDQTGHDFIVRSKYDRLACLAGSTHEKRFDTLLAEQPTQASKIVSIKSLNHYSKTTGKVVRRCEREGLLHLKVVDLKVNIPSKLKKPDIVSELCLRLVEIKEDVSTVPDEEDPIQWRLLTSWELSSSDDAWKVVDAYQQRWDVEQLFRVLKSQGFEIESTQLSHPDRIKKLTIMALGASVKALQLVAARDGQNARLADEIFSPSEIKVMALMLRTLNGTTLKTQNPHKGKSMAWAAWIIARAGGWHGYSSQKPPGPITMTRGLQELETLVAYKIVIDDT